MFPNKATSTAATDRKLHALNAAVHHLFFFTHDTLTHSISAGLFFMFSLRLFLMLRAIGKWEALQRERIALVTHTAVTVAAKRN